jgi:hypothetical protein
MNSLCLTFVKLSKILPFVYIQILCQSRLCKAGHAYLMYLTLQQQLSHLNGRKVDGRQVYASYIPQTALTGWALQWRRNVLLRGMNSNFIYLDEILRVSWTVARLPESWDSKIWSGVPHNSEPRITVLARTKSNLPDSTLWVMGFAGPETKNNRAG